METLRQQKINEKLAFLAYRKWAKPIAVNMSKRFKNERSLAVDDIMQEGLLGLCERGFVLDISSEEQRDVAFKAMNNFSMREFRYSQDKSPLTFESNTDGDDTYTLEIGVQDMSYIYAENINFWNSCLNIMGEETKKAAIYYYRYNLTPEQIMNFTNASKATVYRRLKDANTILKTALKEAESKG